MKLGKMAEGFGIFLIFMAKKGVLVNDKQLLLVWFKMRILLVNVAKVMRTN